jgi:uncharacterized protein (UPF0332 family)
MMRSDEFLVLAVELVAAGSEARRRTAVSRAYYGAFHSAKELLTAAGITLPDTAEAHRKMQMCLKESRVEDARRAGDKLELLRGQRNRADCDLRTADFQRKETAESLLGVTQNLVAVLGTLRVEPAWSQFRSNVRTYAAQVLRLPIAM